MINRILTLLFLCSVSFLQAQTDVGLVTYFSFDDCTGSESRGNPASYGNLRHIQDTICDCGVKGQAIKLNGSGDYIDIVGTVNNDFDTDDFSISFYFKPSSGSGVQTILSKTAGDCSSQSHFAVRYDPLSRFINVQFVENSNKSASINRYRIPDESCWVHAVLVRRNVKTILYINGELIAEVSAATRVNVDNGGVLNIGKSNCSATDRNFNGLIDELRIYNRALTKEEVGELYFPQDQILTDDLRLFLGESFNVEIGNTCATDFEWTPADGVADPFDSESDIAPTESTVYTLNFKDAGCTAFDTIQVIVIDPSELNCSQVFMPSAFTPNGDNLNEVYGISNPEIFTFGGATLGTFEIYDRWGNRVFQTEDAQETWDGSYKGEAVNPGVMLYKVRYTCDGEEKIEAGSLTVIR